MKNQDAVIHYLRDIDRRVRCLTQADVFSGNNPKAYVRSQASFVKTDVRRLAKVLEKLVKLPTFEWPKRRD